MFVVAIDGPAGSGKGTVARIIAKKINALYIDTGAMFRCVALEMLDKKVSLEDEVEIKKILDNIEIKLNQENNGTKVILNGQDVSSKIRTEEVSSFTSPCSTVQIVRDKMLELQREMSKSHDVVMEGRDIGTVVFPDAQVKIYLDATPEERAKRRFLQNQEKGIKSEYDKILEEIKIRDNRDMNRATAPLRKADDAVYLDSTNLDINGVAQKILEVIKENK